MHARGADPEHSRRTLLIGGVSTLPVLLAGYLVYREHLTQDAINFALGTTLVSLVVIPIPVLISRMIYDLRRQVEAAEQLGQYTLEAKIGEGGMGIVYRAHHALLRRPTAIKLLPTHRVGAVSLARFEREVLETSRPRIRTPFRSSTTAAPPKASSTTPWSTSRGFRSSSSYNTRARSRRARGACGAAGARRLVGGAPARLVHRDVKPANLHLCVRGDVPDFVKVLDFGLAKQLGDPRSEAVDRGRRARDPALHGPRGDRRHGRESTRAPTSTRSAP